MKREKINTLSERDLLTGLIVSDNFCKEIIPILEPRQLEIDYVRIISNWIKDYYNTYNKAPMSDIGKLYRAHCSEIQDEALQDNILSCIEKINDDFNPDTKYNEEYAIQESIRYLKSRSLRNLSTDIDAYLITNDIDKAESLITKYRKVEKNSGDGVSLLDDSEIVLNSFTEENDTLFTLPGDFGKLVGKISREDFVAFLAPMKAGKTFQLIDVGIEALKVGLKVVMFSLEMSRTNMIKRAWKTLSGQVTEETEITLPYFEQSGDKYIIKNKTYTKKVSSTLDVEKKQKSLKRMFRGGSFRIYAEPAYSLTVEKLETKLDDLEHDGFIADVIIIDYADIMAPSDRTEYRNQIDGIWKRLRALAQKRKAVVFTASQTNRGAISREVETEDIAEDIRKLAHVTSMVSISKTKYCKEHSLAIYSQLAVREGEPELRKVVATQCLALGRPILDSHWKNEVEFDDEDNEQDEENERFKSKRKKY